MREVTKIKGVSQCFGTKTTIDFDAMLALVNKTRAEILTKQTSFNWNLNNFEMSTREIEKRTTFCYGKGVVGDDYHTYPPGVENYWVPVNGRTCEQGAFIRQPRS